MEIAIVSGQPAQPRLPCQSRCTGYLSIVRIQRSGPAARMSHATPGFIKISSEDTVKLIFQRTKLLHGAAVLLGALLWLGVTLAPIRAADPIKIGFSVSLTGGL